MPASIRILKSYEDVGPLIQNVAQIGDSYAQELGFLPYSAYEELALKDQVWVILSDQTGKIDAYLAFGGSKNAIKVVQLFVSPGSRRKGFGSRLVGELKVRAAELGRQVIAARVASDLASNVFWERNGFYVVRQVPGGESTKRTINVRVFDIPSSSLFAALHESSARDWLHESVRGVAPQVPTYALDLNVFFEVLHSRPEKEFITRMFASAFCGEIRLCVSSELANEIARASRESASDPLLRLASAIPVLDQPEAPITEALLPKLRNIVFPLRLMDRRAADTDESDLRHLASCIISGVRAFVTRERAIIRASGALQAEYGLEILSPQDIVSLSGLTRTWEFQPTRVNSDTAVTTRLYSDADSAQVDELCVELGVAKRDISDFFGASTNSLRKTRVVAILGSTLVGFAAHCVSSHVSSGVRSLVLAREGVTRAQPIVEHLVGGMFSELPRSRLVPCELWTAESQLLTREIAQRHGFGNSIREATGLLIQRKHAYSGIVSPKDWHVFVQTIGARTGTRLPKSCPAYSESVSTGLLLERAESLSKRAIDLHSFESALAPIILLMPNRPAVIVPIRETQANELLPEVRAQAPLFEKEACMFFTRAYFSRSPAARIVKPGTLIVFYISGGGGGRGEAVGVARVVSAGERELHTINSDLFSQGVLSEADLSCAERTTSQIHFFTFDSFAKFPMPVSFREMRSLGLIGKANLVTIQSLQSNGLHDLLLTAGLLARDA